MAARFRAFTDASSYPDWPLLETWIAVYETAAISKAAIRLKVSQASISQRVKQLEDLFRVPLLDRATRPARPTAAGERLYLDATATLDQLRQTREHLRGYARHKQALIRIGCVDSVASALGATLYKGLSGMASAVRLWSGITPVLEAQFDARQLDLVVCTRGPSSPSAVDPALLFSESHLVLLPSAFALEAPCSLHELSARLPLLRYSARSEIGQQIERYLQARGDALPHVCEFDASDPLFSLVEAGAGFAISTPMCLWPSRHLLTGIRVLPLSFFRQAAQPYPPLVRSFHLWSRPGEHDAARLEVYRILRQVMRTQLVPAWARLLGLPDRELWTEAPASSSR